MAENPTSENNEKEPETVKEEVKEEVKKVETTPTPTPTPTSTTVKVDLSELRDALEGLPEKTAQFIREAVQPPKRVNKTATESSESGEAKKSETKPKSKGWLANLLGY